MTHCGVSYTEWTFENCWLSPRDAQFSGGEDFSESFNERISDSCGITSRLRKNYFFPRELRWSTHVAQRENTPQDAQKVRPARPQREKIRRRTLWGTLR